MAESPNISGVILAAGTSSRMGAVKQLLRLHGQPLLRHVLDNVRACALREIILVLGFLAEEIQREINCQDVRVVINHNYPKGMGTSLKAGLAAVDHRSAGALIILADQPYVRSRTLDLLIMEHRRSRAEIVIPTFRGFRGNPLLLDRAVFPDVMAITGDIGCRAIFGDHLEGIVKLAVDDAGILLDIDNREDFEAFPERRKQLDEQPLLQVADLAGPEVAGAATAQPELLIVGRDALAMALARLGKFMRFTVTVVDPLMTPDKIPGADRILHALDFSLLDLRVDRYVVVASRGACDEEAIEQALRVSSSYVALLAKKSRGEEIIRGLRIKGISEETLARVRVPAGLDIGAETPEEIALSIMAEIVAERKR